MIKNKSIEIQLKKIKKNLNQFQFNNFQSMKNQIYTKLILLKKLNYHRAIYLFLLNLKINI
jgi:hypothetical protein